MYDNLQKLPYDVLQSKRAALMLPTFSFSMKKFLSLMRVPHTPVMLFCRGYLMSSINRHIPQDKKSLSLCVNQNQCHLFLNARTHVRA